MSKRRKQCKYEVALRQLVIANKDFIEWLDAEMKRPSDAERGRRVARATNALEMATDRIRHFTLGLDFRKGSKP